MRWAILFFISLGMFGNYYVYDSISPLAEMLSSQLGISDTNIGLLYSIYSIPNVFMVLLSGIIIDRIGTRKGALLFSFFVMFGALCTSFGGSFALMVLGRLIFGIGAESMIVAINTSIARWFKGKEFALAFGLNLTIARLGTFLALNSPSWAKGLYQTGWQGPLYISAAAGVLTVIFVTAYYIFDKYASGKYGLAEAKQQDKINLKGVFAFSKPFWYISILCLVFYAAIFPFQTFAVKFFQHVHHTSQATGAFLSSILTLASMVFTPIFGYLSDRIGRRAQLMMFGSMLIVPVYLLMGYGADLAGLLHISPNVTINIPLLSINEIVPVNLLIPMAIMGIAFSLVPAILWPAVAFTTVPEKLGTAYGLLAMIQNIGLAGFNLLIGFANDLAGAESINPSGYIPGMWIFSVCGLLGVIAAWLLWASGKKLGNDNLYQPVKKMPKSA